MAVVLEGTNAAVSTTYTTLSASGAKRACFIQAANNIFLRVSGGTSMVILGDSTGLHWDLGCNAPNSIEVAAISGTASVTLWSLDPGERR